MVREAALNLQFAKLVASSLFVLAGGGHSFRLPLEIGRPRLGWEWGRIASATPGKHLVS